MRIIFNKTWLIGCIAVCLCLISCKKELDNVTKTNIPAVQELSTAKLDQNRTEFAKIFAKAIADKDVKKLIKAEAAKQFNQDYDVLFQLVKDNEIRPGLSLYNYLASFAASREAFDDLIESLPLLTIFVPNFSHFSASKGDVSSQTPLVTVVNSTYDEKSNTKLIAFNDEGNTTELDDNVVPDKPVIVIKENESVLNVSKSSSAKLLGTGSMLFQNEKSSFYFIDDVFDKRKEKGVRGNVNPRGSSFDPRVKEAYDKQKAYNCATCYQRDYLYYNIFPPEGKDSGPLKLGYKEAVTSIQFINTLPFDDLGGWTEGNYEFNMNAVFLQDKNPALPQPRKFYARPKDLFTFPTYPNRGGGIIPGSFPTGTKQFFMSPLVYIT
jgi:hypothetical protein